MEERILDAAAKVFLDRGFEGATIDEIAEEARAGKPTIYARFPSKEALFSAVMARKIRENTRPESVTDTGSSAEERLRGVGKAIVDKTLASETLELTRVTAAEARRFPDLANAVSRMARERGIEAVAKILSELAITEEMGALPAFAPDRLASTARRFLDLILLPMLVRALFGEDLASLRAEADAHVSQSVAFFLAACRYGALG